MKYTINKTKEVVYAAKNFQTGLTDVVLTIRKPDGTILTPAPTITEQGEGLYTASYTPDAIGTWQEKISSVSNGDLVFRSFVVGNYDNEDLQNQINGVETKVDTANVTLGNIDGKADTISTKIDGVQSTADSIESKVNALDLEISPGGYFA